MPVEKYYLGPAPADEECVSLGVDNCEELARRECRAYIEAIKQVCGQPPEGARLKIERQRHDFGDFMEVVVLFDPSNREAAEYAAKCDAQAPTRWPEKSTNIKFLPGSVDVTLGAQQVASLDDIRRLLDRHTSGDWGDLCEEDKRANDSALKHGGRILSAYHVNGEKLWVLTEASREQTTVLTPGEY